MAHHQQEGAVLILLLVVLSGMMLYVATVWHSMTYLCNFAYDRRTSIEQYYFTRSMLSVVARWCRDNALTIREYIKEHHHKSLIIQGIIPASLRTASQSAYVIVDLAGDHLNIVAHFMQNKQERFTCSAIV